MSVIAALLSVWAPALAEPALDPAAMSVLLRSSHAASHPDARQAILNRIGLLDVGGAPGLDPADAAAELRMLDHGLGGLLVTHIVRMDTDGDRAVSREEFRATQNEPRGTGRPSIFRTLGPDNEDALFALDRDGDGRVTLPEARRRPERVLAEDAPITLYGMLLFLDSDGDAVVTTEEFSDGYARHIAAMDRNGTGGIDADELR